MNFSTGPLRKTTLRQWCSDRKVLTLYPCGNFASFAALNKGARGQDIDKTFAVTAAIESTSSFPVLGSLLAKPNSTAQARQPSPPSRSSSRIAWTLSHPPRHPSQMVTVGRIPRDLLERCGGHCDTAA